MSNDLSPRRTRPMASLLLLVCVVVVGTVGAQDVSTVSDAVEPLPFASNTAPFTNSQDIAIVSDNVACVIDSFESQIHCVDRSDGSRSVFGSEGEGPGEFTGIVGIERGRDGQLLAIDYGDRSLTVFKPDGTRISETRLPPEFNARQFRGDRLFGFKLVMPDFSAGEFQPSYVPMEVDAYSGDVQWERTDLGDIIGRDCFNPAISAFAPSGGLVFQVCEYELAFFAAKDAQSATVVASPNYVLALPNERDVGEHMGVFSSVGLPKSDEEIEAAAAAFRKVPKEWILKPHAFAFDDQDRLWVATTYNRDTYSYFDIWTGTEYDGMVRIQDRLMGFDILGSTLVTLVERSTGDMAIDWYDLAGVSWSR